VQADVHQSNREPFLLPTASATSSWCHSIQWIMHSSNKKMMYRSCQMLTAATKQDTFQLKWIALLQAIATSTCLSLGKVAIVEWNARPFCSWSGIQEYTFGEVDKNRLATVCMMHFAWKVNDHSPNCSVESKIGLEFHHQFLKGETGGRHDAIRSDYIGNRSIK